MGNSLRRSCEGLGGFVQSYCFGIFNQISKCSPANLQAVWFSSKKKLLMIKVGQQHEITFSEIGQTPQCRMLNEWQVRNSEGNSATLSHTESSTPGKVFLASRMRTVDVSSSHTVTLAWLFCFWICLRVLFVLFWVVCFFS